MLLDADLFEAGGAACNTFGVKCVAVVVDAAEQLAAHKSKSTQGCYCCYDDNCGWCCTAPMRVLTACAVMLSHQFRSATVLRVASILEHVRSSFGLMPHTEPRCESAEVVTCCVGGVAKTRLPMARAPLASNRYSTFKAQENACDAAPGSCAQQQPADYFDSDYAKYQARRQRARCSDSPLCTHLRRRWRRWVCWRRACWWRLW